MVSPVYPVWYVIFCFYLIKGQKGKKYTCITANLYKFA